MFVCMLLFPLWLCELYVQFDCISSWPMSVFLLCISQLLWLCCMAVLKVSPSFILCSYYSSPQVLFAITLRVPVPFTNHCRSKGREFESRKTRLNPSNLLLVLMSLMLHIVISVCVWYPAILPSEEQLPSMLSVGSVFKLHGQTMSANTPKV